MPIQLNEVVDRGINIAVSRRLGLADQSLSLLPELGVNMLLPADELLFHMGWRRHQRAATQAAVAAQAAIVKLRNPASSNVMVLLERVIVSAGAGVFIETGTSTLGDTTDLATLVTPGTVNRDTRQATALSSGGCNAIISQTTSAVALTTGGSIFRIAVANTAYELPGAPWILVPGTSFQIGDSQLNDKLEYTFYWRERILNDQENSL